MDENPELNFTKLKYVLYARKSTDDPQRQVRSIGDQIFECKQLAARLGLNIIKILDETFYYGILVQAKQPVDLREIYNFQPATHRRYLQPSSGTITLNPTLRK